MKECLYGLVIQKVFSIINWIYPFMGFDPKVEDSIHYQSEANWQSETNSTTITIREALWAYAHTFLWHRTIPGSGKQNTKNQIWES